MSRSPCAGRIGSLFQDVAKTRASDAISTLDRRLPQGEMQFDAGDLDHVSVRQ